MLRPAPPDPGEVRYPVPGADRRRCLPAAQPPGGRQNAGPLRQIQAVRVLKVVTEFPPIFYF